MEAVVTDEQWVRAGEAVATGLTLLRDELDYRRTDGRHALEDKILDHALIDAGIIAPDENQQLIRQEQELRELLDTLRDEWVKVPGGYYIRPA